MKKDMFELIYERYAKELYLYAFSLCKDYHLAQDLVSDTFFKALLALNDDNLEIKYWLFRVCKNLWLDILKKKKHYTNTPFEDTQLSIQDNTLEKLIENEEKLRLYLSILKLPPSNVEIIFLFYYCHMPLNDIALNLNLSSGAARTLLYRSRQKLKELLREE